MKMSIKKINQLLYTEITTDSNKTICGLCKGLKATQTSPSQDGIEKQNSGEKIKNIFYLSILTS